MSKRYDAPRLQQQRTHIASVAARLMADGAIADFDQAKRKAAISLGLPENVEMPDTAEIEAELGVYQRLFQGDEHDEDLHRLRRKAVDLMVILQPYRPYLTGSVLEGSAGRYSEIDLQLFVDSSKEVEIFLLNQRIEYAHSVPRNERAEAVLTLSMDDTDCNLIIYPMREERVVFKTRSGKIRPRARLDAVRKLLLSPLGELDKCGDGA
jgi:hypothetical protein